MSGENPSNIIRSWNLQTGFSTGPVVSDKLTPPQYGRIRTPFVTTWREEQLSSNLDWGSSQFSIYLPESLKVIASIYLRINLPALGAGMTYKNYCGLYAMRRLRIMSAGTEVYSCDVGRMLADYCQSLSDEQLREFAKIYLGHEATPSNAARTILIPILLPNSAYGARGGHDTRGHGVFPAFLGQNRLELQVSLNAATFVASDPANAPASISGQCSLMYHEVKTTDVNQNLYSDLRGAYSVITRRFTELTAGWQAYAVANAVVRHTTSQPQGVVTEIQIIAVAENDDEHRYSKNDLVQATSLKVIADSIVQRDLDSPFKIRVENWTNGFVPPADFPSPTRMCFSAHAAENTHVFSGGYNMTLASQIQFEFAFAVPCRFKIFAVQLQRVKIDSLGIMRAYLE